MILNSENVKINRGIKQYFWTFRKVAFCTKFWLFANLLSYNFEGFFGGFFLGRADERAIPLAGRRPFFRCFFGKNLLWGDFFLEHIIPGDFFLEHLFWEDFFLRDFFLEVFFLRDFFLEDFLRVDFFFLRMLRYALAKLKN